jgi:hypothetical protein
VLGRTRWSARCPWSATWTCSNHLLGLKVDAADLKASLGTFNVGPDIHLHGLLSLGHGVPDIGPGGATDGVRINT